MNRKFLFLMILTFLLATVICSSVIKSELFVSAKQRAPVTAENCVETKPTMKGAVVAERCCSTTTTFNANGVPTTSSTTCNTCEYAGGGSLVGCHAYMGAPPPGELKPNPKAGPESSSVLSPSEQSNNTNPLKGKILEHGDALKGGSEPNSGITIKSNDTLQ
jgi:hypothetical protein